MHAPATRIYEFADFRVDPSKRLLRRRDGDIVPLTPRVFDTLLFLVENADRVLDKEEIMEAVWPDSIVEENNLTQNISTLRRVFGETPGSHRFIVTVPGRGYRFVAGVNSVAAAADELSAHASNGHAAEPAVPVIVEQPTKSSLSRFSRKHLFTAAVLVALVLAVAFWSRHPRSQQVSATTAAPSKSIAVLPFDNLSNDRANSYFAAAVQDEILTNLAHSPELKVISRMSANMFSPGAGQKNARDIGQQLGVAYLLEGSVQRVGERVRVHAQLIDARTDTHVWAQSYDRDLADMFAIQSEIATAIAQQLQAKLTPAEDALGLPKAPATPQAYLLYLRAKHAQELDSDPREIVQLYDQAIAADPTFALPHAHLSILIDRGLRGHAGDALRGRARFEAEEALRLNPELGEAHVAMAYWYLEQGDYDRASAEVARAGQLMPSSSEVPLLTAFICKAKGRFRDRLAALRRAQLLDPANVHPYSFLVLTLRWLREWQQAIDAMDQRAVFGGSPLEFVSAWARASDEFRLTGNIDALKRAVAEDARHPESVPAALVNFEQYQIAMFDRDFGTARQFLNQVPAAEFNEKLSNVAGHLKQTHEVLLGFASNADATTMADAVASAENAPDSAPPMGGRIVPAIDRALVHALAGRKEQAVGEIQSFLAQSARTGSAIEGNDGLCALAAIYAQSGEQDKALDLIEHLLTVPTELECGRVYNMTLTDLKWCWIWDPIRSNERFQKLIAAPEPRTIY